MGILDLERCGDPPVWDAAAAALAGGLTSLQLRAKRSCARTVFDAARALGSLCNAAGVPLIVNDRPDIAVAAGAAGAHVGPDDLPPEAARKVLGTRLLGVSARTLDRLRAAEEARADYVGTGAVRGTGTKPEAVAIGVAGVAGLCAATRLPVIAVGGVAPGDVPALLAAGAAGVAVAGGIFGAPDPGAAARAYRDALRAAGS